MVEISIKDLKGRFADYCNNLLTYNKALNEEFSIDGIIESDIKKYGRTAYFTLTDDDKSSVKVKVGEEYFEKMPELYPGNRVNVKGSISLNKAGYIKGFELVQFGAVEIERLSNTSSEYNKALMYVCMSKKVKRAISFGNKSFMTVAVITSRDGEGLPDVQYALGDCDYFRLKHVPTNMFKPEEIAENIRSTKDVDIIVIVRGGTTNVDIFNDIRILRAVAESKSYTVCGIGHAQQEPLINRIVDVEQSTPTSAGMYLKNSYDSYLRSVGSAKQAVEFSNKDREKTWLIAVLVVIIVALVLKYRLF
jgi:exonuclease VII large subunit